MIRWRQKMMIHLCINRKQKWSTSINRYSLNHPATLCICCIQYLHNQLCNHANGFCVFAAFTFHPPSDEIIEFDIESKHLSLILNIYVYVAAIITFSLTHHILFRTKTCLISVAIKCVINMIYFLLYQTKTLIAIP